MAHEILSVKLCELDDRISRLHGRIHLSESSNSAVLNMETKEMEKECRESHQALSERLHHSQSGAVAGLSQAYDTVEEAISEMKWGGGRESADEKILLAEYALDFALLAAETAVCKALEAIIASRNEERRGCDGRS